MSDATDITSADQLGVSASDVRTWAREQGLEVAPTGRISRDVLAAYAAANPQ